MGTPTHTPTRRRFLAAAGSAGIAATAGCVSVEAPTYGGTWSRWGFDDDRAGFTSADGPAGDLYAAWRADVFEGAPPSTPVVTDGRVYHLHTRADGGPGRESVVSAFDAATGDERWRTVVSTAEGDDAPAHHDSLVVDDDRLYVRTVDGLHALSVGGDRLWTHPVPTTSGPSPRTAPPVVSAGMVVTATYGSRPSPAAVVGVDAETGAPRWRAGFAARRTPWTLSADVGTVYVPFLGGDAGLVALDQGVGKTEWQASLPVDGPVTVADDRLLVPLREGDAESIAAVDRTTREVRWRKPASRRTGAGVAVGGELVYHCADGRLTARRLDTGDRVWSFGPDPAVSPSWTPVVAGEVVYAVAERRGRSNSPNVLYALDAGTGAVRGSGRLSVSSSPSGLAVVDGAAYVGLGRGELLCVESCALSLAGRCLAG